MIAGAVCMSHSPLLDRIRAPEAPETAFHAALDRVRDRVAAMKPDLVVLFFPDHVNGFFYDMLPAFCVGVEGVSIGDYGTAAGALPIPAAAAESLAASLIAQGIDTAVSYKMEVDRGGAQPVELLSERAPLPPFIPVFINAAAAPRPGFARVRALGEAVGRWAAARPERVLVVGSGGLSHDPPIPALATATPDQRAMLINGGPSSFAQRFARQNRVYGEGLKAIAGTSDLLPLNPDWDRALLSAFTEGRLDLLDTVSDAEISATGGRGGHEVRCWFAALAALAGQGGYAAEVAFYEPVIPWITGMGVLSALPA